VVEPAACGTERRRFSSGSSCPERVQPAATKNALPDRRPNISTVYLVVVVLISMVGTLISDTLVDRYQIPLYVTSVVFAIVLAIVFIAWQRSEGTLSVHDIRTTKREAFYWSAILFTFALGTSAGDLIAEASHLGYSLSVLLFASGIAIAYAQRSPMAASASEPRSPAPSF
jgi:uncharacterized membrane-anchored protein